ncbi:MAG: aminotransferase class IV [Bacteroidales bacterium]|nr:aminotransferase class IV [Bacteroidales bacterium]
MACTADFFIINDMVFPTKKFNISELEKGITIYEVVKIIEATPLFIEDHIIRLFESAKIKKLKIWLKKENIIKQVLKLIEINKIKRGRLKFALRFHESENILICFFLQDIEPDNITYKKGVKLISKKAERENPNAKVINYKLRKSVKSRMKKENAFETLLISKSGKITECSKSNIFFIKDNYLYTPKSKDILKGITREHIFNICKENNIKIIETDLYQNDIKKYDSVFITGTSVGVLTVNQIDNHIFSKENELLQQISKLYFSIVKTYTKNLLSTKK